MARAVSAALDTYMHVLCTLQLMLLRFDAPPCVASGWSRRVELWLLAVFRVCCAALVPSPVSVRTQSAARRLLKRTGGGGVGGGDIISHHKAKSSSQVISHHKA